MPMVIVVVVMVMMMMMMIVRCCSMMRVYQFYCCLITYLALRKLVFLGSIHHRNWRQTHLLLFVTLFMYVIYRLNFSDQSYRVYSSNAI